MKVSLTKLNYFIMRKILFSLFATAALCATDVMKAQTVLFEDSFETYTDFAIANVGNWTLTDVDLKPTYGFTGITFPNTGVAKSFQVFNSTTTTPPMTPTATSNWTAKTGTKMMVSFAATSSPWNNDWLISPQIGIPAGDGATLTFYGKGCDADYGAEKFKVLVSTTGTGVETFTAISPLVTTPSDAQWHQYTYDLNSYAGQNIYIAIQTTSDDQFGFAVDDFKVVSNALPTAAPNCATLTTPANNTADVSYKVPLSLAWTAPTTGEAAASYDVYFGTSANPTTLLINTTTLTTTVPISMLTPATTYYWNVIAKNAAGSATGCTSFSFTTMSMPASAPNCATLTAPANGATGVDYLAPSTLTWTAPSSGTVVDSYDVYFGTTANPSTLLVNTTSTTATVPVTQLAASTTYYWRVVPKNDTGAATGCTEFSFTTAANPFAPYCGPVSITSNTEPITLVNFAGINNVTSPTLNGTPDHENFTSIVGNVAQGSSYEIILQGNTGGNWVNRFAVFIDWNQNGILNDAGEVYQITQTITNSTGTDAIQAVQQLAVPTDAALGNTRMRVKKIFGTTNYLDPCANASFGQLEDYTLNVTSLGVNDNMKNSVKIYPNPVVEMLNIESPNKVKSVSVFDATGKVVSTYSLNASKSQINLSKLAPGVYVVNIEMENETKSIKVIKK